MQFAIRHGNVEAVAEIANIFVRELFGLVYGVFAFTRFAHAVAFDGFNQNNGWLATVGISSGKCGIDLLRVMPATAQAPDFVIAHVGYQFGSFGVAVKEVFAYKSAIIGFVGLVVAIEHFHHQLAQFAAFIACEQWLPVAAPDELNHVPAAAAKLAFEFLNDFAVTTHGAIEPLQVAIDDKNQVIKSLTRRHADSTQTFNFVHFAIAAKRPYLALGSIGNAACVQVFEETRLINRHKRPQPHAYGGELPKIRHQLGVRVAR